MRCCKLDFRYVFPWLLAVILAAVSAAADPQSDEMLTLQTRSRAENPAGSGQVAITVKPLRWDPKKTAVIVCDMWARHWCDGACDRGAQMAARMNRFVGEARSRGVLIVHAPSGGMEHYADHPARRRAQNAPKADNVPEGMAGWGGKLASEKNAVWPIDQSDGGCDCQPRCPSRAMDVRQTEAIKIHDEDAISDSGVECWNLFEQGGIENVILVGVHTNMCVIGRPFGLRNMVRVGKNVLLVRDLTDTMYNSRRKPLVSHVRGTDLVVEYIEKYVCPTITSCELLGGQAVRFKEDKRPHVVFLVNEDEYGARETMPGFAEVLRHDFGCYCTVVQGRGGHDLSGVAALETADVAVLFVRRKALPEPQMEKIRRYLDSGKPLVALRTASHAFDARGRGPAGYAEWPSFDGEVLGGNYHGHGSNSAGTEVAVVAKAAADPILAGVRPPKWHSRASIYWVSPLAENAEVLLTGTAGDKTEPVAWTHRYRGGRVFYTSLGHRSDFLQPQFRTLLVNAVHWAMGKPVPEVVSKGTPGVGK